MKLKNGVRIEIKRITRDGLKKSLVEYFECNGIQYGIMTYREDMNYYLIHLDTGYSAAEIPIKKIKKPESIDFLKQKACELDKKMLKEAVRRVKVEMKASGFKFPLN